MGKPQHHIIYVPGILDDIYRVQSTPVRLWRLHGMHGHTHEIPWAGSEPWQPKLERLLAEVDRLAAQGHRVSLIGASAGASAVLNAYAERRDRITGVVYIAAKINAPGTVSAKIYAQNPAFKTSLLALQDNLKLFTAADKSRMHSFYSPCDGTVPYAATVIPGVSESRLPSLKHGRAIMYALTFGSHRLLAPLKKLAAAEGA